MSTEAGNGVSTRQERRARKLRKKRERMKKHGKGMASMYREAILKRLRRKRGSG
jgi:hypothetical protein